MANAGIIASKVHGDATALTSTAAPQSRASWAHLFIAVGNFCNDEKIKH